MIDAVLKYTDEASALADLASYNVPNAWALDHAIPNIMVWRASQDVNGVHTPLAGFFVLVSLPRVILALRDNPAIQVVIDRDRANAGLPGAVIKSSVTTAVLQDLRIAPVFAGSNYPFGAWQ